MEEVVGQNIHDFNHLVASEFQEEATTPERGVACAPVVAALQASSCLDGLSSSPGPCARASWRPVRHSIPVSSVAQQLQVF